MISFCAYSYICIEAIGIIIIVNCVPSYIIHMYGKEYVICVHMLETRAIGG